MIADVVKDMPCVVTVVVAADAAVDVVVVGKMRWTFFAKH